jgi:hypothetical protein
MRWSGEGRVAAAACLAVWALALGARPLRAQTDAERFATARIAMEKKDCPVALNALEGYSEGGRSDPLWVLQMARVHECLGHLEDALSYYRQYDKIVPGQPEISKKLGEVSYNLAKKKESEEKAGQEEAVRRAEELRRRDAAVERAAAAILAAKTQLPQTLSELRKHLDGIHDFYEMSFYGDQGGYWHEKERKLRRHVTAADGCAISFHEDTNWALGFHGDVTIPLADITATPSHLDERDRSNSWVFLSYRKGGHVQVHEDPGHKKNNEPGDYSILVGYYRWTDEAAKIAGLLNSASLACSQ